MGVAAPRVYLDSCIVIYLVEEHAAYAAQIRSAIAMQPESQFCISPLCELECLVGPLKLGDSALQAQYEQFFATLCRLDMPDEVYRSAARLRATHNLRTPDAIHIATAQHHGCMQLWTNDDRLSRATPMLTISFVQPSP